MSCTVNGWTMVERCSKSIERRDFSDCTAVRRDMACGSDPNVPHQIDRLVELNPDFYKRCLVNQSRPPRIDASKEPATRRHTRHQPSNTHSGSLPPVRQLP